MGIGVDIVDVARFERLVAQRGSAFTTRWFTWRERELCAVRRNPGAAHAELFAVKEAVWKSLGVGAWTHPIAWRDIEVCPSDSDGYRVVHLGGAAAMHAHRARISSVRAASAVAGGVATATAIATR